MEKFIKYLFIFLIILSLGTSVYMEVNRFHGEPHFYGPHEYTKELTQEISAKDRLYVTFWFTLPALSIYILVGAFKTLMGHSSEGKVYKIILMLVVYIYAFMNVIKGFSVLGIAQMLTNKTNKFIMPWTEFMAPFMTIAICLLVIYGIKVSIVYNRKKHFARNSKFEVLSSIIREKN